MKRTARTVLATVAATAAIAATGTAVATATSTPPPPPRAHWMKVPCVEEDSTNCTWNAAALGNHLGHSFYRVTREVTNAHDVRLGRVICVYYVKRADARRWDGCHLLPNSR